MNNVQVRVAEDNYYNNKLNFILNEIYTVYETDDLVLSRVLNIIGDGNSNDLDQDNAVNNANKYDYKYKVISELSYFACDLFRDSWLSLIYKYLDDNEIYLENKGDLIPNIERDYYYRDYFSSRVIVELIMEILHFNTHIRNNINYFNKYRDKLVSLVFYDDMNININMNYDYNYIHRVSLVADQLPYRDL